MGLTKPSVPSRKSCCGGNKKILFQFNWYQIIPTLSFPSDLLRNYHGAKIFMALPAYWNSLVVDSSAKIIWDLNILPSSLCWILPAPEFLGIDTEQVQGGSVAGTAVTATDASHWSRRRGTVPVFAEWDESLRRIIPSKLLNRTSSRSFQFDFCFVDYSMLPNLFLS